MNYKLIFLFIFISSILISCDSENAPECFKKSGRLTEKEIKVDSFNRLVIWDEADIYLVPGSTQEIRVKAGGNLIPDIHFDVSEQTLTITNENHCLWVRGQSNPVIYISCPDLYEIEIYDFANIYSSDTLRYDYLRLASDGTGNFDLDVNVDSLVVFSIYISNFRISGETDFLDIYFINDSQFDGRDLLSQRNKVVHLGSNRIDLYPLQSLIGQIRGTGNIYYFHKPSVLDVNVYGTGRLIDETSIGK